MRETAQSPVSRKTFCARLEDPHGIFMDIQTNDGSVLTLYDDTLFPEISVLFVGDAGKFNDTVEVCGMYDKKAHEFRFVSDRLASIADGISETERWTGAHTSEADRLLKVVPERGYVGTVLSPHVLIRARYQSRQFQNHFGWYGGCVSLTEFCEKNHLPEPDMSGSFPEEKCEMTEEQTKQMN